MSVFDNIQDRINKRAAELVLPRFLELEAARHAKNGFREGCPCTYCRAKRAATSEIGHIGRSFETLPPIPPRAEASNNLDNWEQRQYIRAVLRESLRQKHRKILKERFEENGQDYTD